MWLLQLPFPFVLQNLDCNVIIYIWNVFYIPSHFYFRKVNEKVKAQLDKLWHTTQIYMHPNIHEYAEKLTAKFPGDLKVIFTKF